MKLRHLLFAAALSLGAGAWAHPTVSDPSRYVTTQLTVTGAVEHPLKLSVDDLRQMTPQQLGERKGVRLRDLLERAAIISRDHNDVKKMAIIATASDGYSVVYSWSEVFNTAVGDEVLVIFEKGGQALADDEGRIAMVSGKDLRAGPRHVKWLKSIEIKKIVD